MELMEKVNAANSTDENNDSKCPFCYEKPIGHATDQPQKVNDKVKSVPSSLKCTTKYWKNSQAAKKRTTGNLPYTLAQHHAISAMQCYAKIRQLVRMGNMVGYNINDPVNGIGLPTTYWSMKYPEHGKMKQYGKLDDPEGKKRVSFALMSELGAQWHVGHHAFKVERPKIDYDSFDEGGAEEKNEDDLPHETSYDIEVISLLFSLVQSFPKSLCEEENYQDKFKAEMDEISMFIKDCLREFAGENPANSYPFFVSKRAAEFSAISENPPHDDLPINDQSY